LSEKKQSKKSATSKANGRTAGKGTGKGGSGGGSPMNVDLLQQIVGLMAANDLNTVDVRDGARRIILKRGANVVVQQGGPVQYGAPAAGAAPAVQGGGGAAAALPAADPEAGLTAIKSPMVGTFYAASSPDAKPFVSVGTNVDEDTDVCVIEAMKVFNNIKAECRGTIAKVMVNNGQTVEFGQTLFLVKGG
jgi:acetyl-CoA carboxylase biotin carboxyl carrier protein